MGQDAKVLLWQLSSELPKVLGLLKQTHYFAIYTDEN